MFLNRVPCRRPPAPLPPSFLFSSHLYLPVGHRSQFSRRFFLFTPGQAAHQLVSSAQKHVNLHWVQKPLVKYLDRLLGPRYCAAGAEGTSACWQLIEESLPVPGRWW